MADIEYNEMNIFISISFEGIDFNFFFKRKTLRSIVWKGSKHWEKYIRFNQILETNLFYIRIGQTFDRIVRNQLFNELNHWWKSADLMTQFLFTSFGAQVKQKIKCVSKRIFQRTP